MSGAVWLLAANLIHNVIGFLIFLVAARIMPPGRFGDLSQVMAVALVVEVLVKQGVPRAISHAIAHRGEQYAEGLVRLGLWLNMIVAIVLWGFTSAIAPIANAALPSWPIVWLVLAGLDQVAFAPFLVLAGRLNGLHQFRAQAAINLAYSTCKLFALTGSLLLNPTVEGGIGGYLIGSAMGSLLAYAHWRATRSRLTDRPVDVPGASWCLSFGLPIALYGFVLEGFLVVDVLAFRYQQLAMTEPAWAVLGAQEAADRGNDSYAAAVYVSRVVYFVFLASGEAVFPSIAKALAGDAKRVGAMSEHIKRALRLLLVLAVPAIGLGIGAGAATTEWAFGPDRRDIAGLLPWMLPMTGVLVVANVLCAALAASHRGWAALGIVAAALMANVALNALPADSANDPAMRSFLAALLMLSMGAWGVTRIAGTGWIPWRTMMLVAPGAAALWWIGARLSPENTVPTWTMFPMGFVAYPIVAGAIWRLDKLCHRLPATKV